MRTDGQYGWCIWSDGKWGHTRKNISHSPILDQIGSILTFISSPLREYTPLICHTQHLVRVVSESRFENNGGGGGGMIIAASYQYLIATSHAAAAQAQTDTHSLETGKQRRTHKPAFNIGPGLSQKAVVENGEWASWRWVYWMVYSWRPVSELSTKKDSRLAASNHHQKLILFTAGNVNPTQTLVLRQLNSLVHFLLMTSACVPYKNDKSKMKVFCDISTVKHKNMMVRFLTASFCMKDVKSALIIFFWLDQIIGQSFPNAAF